MNISVEVACQFCLERHKFQFDLPSGFVVSEFETAYAKGFCEKHAHAKPFLDAQCPGCVCSFPDCGLGKSTGLTMRGHEAFKVRTGVCPFRVNGTIGFQNGRVEHIDLSDRAPEGSGEAILAALNDRHEQEESTIEYQSRKQE